MSRIGGKILTEESLQKLWRFRDIKGFDYTFKKGERIGLLKNGVGKSTFLNIITQTETADSGKINTGDTIHGYFSNKEYSLKDKRVIEVLRHSRCYCNG